MLGHLNNTTLQSHSSLPRARKLSEMMRMRDGEQSLRNQLCYAFPFSSLIHEKLDIKNCVYVNWYISGVFLDPVNDKIHTNELVLT